MAGRASTFEHEADMGVAGEGATPEEAFAAAAEAMFGLMVELEDVRPLRAVDVACEAPDRELLFVEWLNALLAAADLEGLLLCRFEARIDGDRLSGRAWGEPFDAARHARGTEVKGATLTGLDVRQGPGGWCARTVVDL